MLTRLSERLRVGAAFVLVAISAAALPAVAYATPTDVVNTVHNLSVSGTGTVRALTETRICVFCHTPHNATPASPLWNKDLEPRVYTVYASPTLVAGPLPQPSGATKLCLSCHDGTIAMGAVVNPAGGIPMASGNLLPSDSLSNFGLDLSGHHPVSFSYQASLPNPELVPSAPPELSYGGFDEIHCTTCHDPHDDRNGKFLAKDNRYSALCTTCHQLNGWLGSAHATSTASVVGILPRPPKTWPAYAQLGEWGCESCHTPHFAPTAEGLSIFTTLGAEPFSCTSAGCHSSEPPPSHLSVGTASAMRAQLSTGGAVSTMRAATAGPRSVGMADIGAQTRKPSAHHEVPGMPMTALRVPAGSSRFGMQAVSCVDCHNPHVTAVSVTKTNPPFASAALRGVSGVDRNGMPVSEARYEYEVCFKCHGDFATGIPYIPRVVNDLNMRREFDPANASFHPVIGSGTNVNVPSIPSSTYLPSSDRAHLSASSMIYCTDCHADDEGESGGPHGSDFPPILKEKYETADGTPENYDNYALCYRCHERNSILGDQSFRTNGRQRGGHSGHVRDSHAPCSVCHDAHGVSELKITSVSRGDSALTGTRAGSGGVPTGGSGALEAASGPPKSAGGARGIGGLASATGSHTHLINFDTRIVLPKGDARFPTFTDTGTFSGSCNLVCHGVDHDNWSYP